MMTHSKSMHGRMGKEKWPNPEQVANADVEARPGYNSCQAHEYIDTPEVMREKITLLANMIRSSQNCVAYTGAGISTAAGIDDYASVAPDSVTGGHNKCKRSPMEAEPTLAHSALTALYQTGYLKHWVQQNHDGLPQKAGYPQHALNEIHGAWFDPANPVVKMEGSLRGDLFSWLLQWEKRADLCLAIGTSLAGMNADRIASATARRQGSLGTVIVSLQQTKLDHLAVLRIFGRTDDVMRALATELSLKMPEVPDYSKYHQTPAVEDDDLYWIGYGSDGLPLTEGQPRRLLDLSEGARVRITSGPYEGHEGEVLGRSRRGHYQIRFMHPIQRSGGKGSWLAPMTHTLGMWIVDEANRGLVSSFPVESLASPCAEREDQILARQQVAALRAAGITPRPSEGEQDEAAEAQPNTSNLAEWVRQSYLEGKRKEAGVEEVGVGKEIQARTGTGAEDAAVEAGSGRSGTETVKPGCWWWRAREIEGGR